MIYIIKFTICLTLLLAIYHLVLEKEKMHQFNRFFLLGGLIFSLIIPFLELYTLESFVATTNLIADTPHVSAGDKSITTQMFILTWFQANSWIFLTLYLLVTGFLFIRFSKVLEGFFNQIKSNPNSNYKFAKIVLVNEQIQPHTFMNYIFINKDEFEKQRIESELLTHELAHVRNWHTIDNLLVELIHTILWFNPIFIYLKKAIRLNHEYQADEAAIIQYADVAHYQQILLSKSHMQPSYQLASNMNYSLTKKRFKMMTANKSKMAIALKQLFILPLFFGLTMMFSCDVSSQDRATAEMVKEYNSLASQANENGVESMKKSDLMKLEKLYDKMSEEQRKAVVNNPMPNLNDEHGEHEHKGHDGDAGHDEANHKGHDHDGEHSEHEHKGHDGDAGHDEANHKEHDHDGEHDGSGHDKDNKEHKNKKEGSGHDKDDH